MEQGTTTIPSRWRYLLGLLFALGGVFGFVVLLVNTVSPDLRIVMPRSHQIEMGKGNYTLFYEYRSEINGQVYSSEIEVPGIRVAVISPDGAGVELAQLTMNENYKIGGRLGYSVLEFQVEKDGIYTIVGGFPDGTTGTDIVMAIGKKDPGSVLFATLSLLGGLIVASVLVIGTLMTRRPTRPLTKPVAVDVTAS